MKRPFGTAGALLLLLASTAAAACLAWAPPAAAQSEEDLSRARIAFERGVGQFEGGNFQAALDSFQTAQRLAPHPNVRVNMANCYESLGRPVEALFHFRRFLAEAGGAPPAQRREVQAAVQRLEGAVAEVTFQIAPDGAQVRIDGAEIRRAPIIGPVMMAAGAHLVEVRSSGFEQVRREIRVQGGEPAHVVIALDELPAADPSLVAASTGPGATDGGESAAALTGPQAEESGETPSDAGSPSFASIRLPTWVAAGATAALLLGAGITGSLAVGAENDVEALRLRSEDENLTFVERQLAFEQAVDDANRADSLALATDVLGGLALAGAVATGVLLFLDLTRNEGEASPTLTFTPALTPDSVGGAAGGRF